MVIENINEYQPAHQQIATNSLNNSSSHHFLNNNNHRNTKNNLPLQNNSHNNTTAGSSNSVDNIICNDINNSGSVAQCNANGSSGITSSNNNGGCEGAILVGGGTSAAAAKNQLEQLNTMREALFSQDGWGCQHVNQDTNWEVPSSPEPANKDPAGGPPLWKPTVNNGTDLWESNLRNGGQPPSQPIQKTPWGHTPSSNLGGTWGEDDDGADSNVWTGSANNAGSAGGVGVGTGATGGQTSGPQWGQNVVGVGIGTPSNVPGTGSGSLPVVSSGAAQSSTIVNVPGNNGGGGSTAGNSGNGWGDPREIRSGGATLSGGPIDMRGVDPRDQMRAASAGDPRDLRMLDPRDPIRGDPRGISGRLNGTSEMWGHHQPISHSQMPTINKMVGQVVGGVSSVVGPATIAPGGVTSIGAGGVTGGGVTGNVGSQWGPAATQSVVGPKDITKQVTGWEEPSPPPQRRNIPNYDDGTSLWGQQNRVPGGGSHWKEMSDSLNRSHLMRTTIGPQNPPNSGGIGSSSVPGNGNVQVVSNPNNPMAGVVGPQTRLTSTVGGPGIVGASGQHKSDNGMWVHQSGGGRNPNAAWADESHNVGTGQNWVDDKSNSGLAQIGANTNSWIDSPAGGGWNNKQHKLSAAGGSGWSTTPAGNSNDANELNADWSAHGSGIVGKSQQQKMVGVGGINIDMIKQSKQYRILVETGFKKDDVERALISANMNIDEAAEILRSLPSDSWRRHDETLGVAYTDHTNTASGVGGGGGFSGRYPNSAGAQPTMSFPPNNLLNNMGGAGTNNPNLAALQVQKNMYQGQHNVALGPPTVNTATAAPIAFGQQQGAANSNAPVNISSNTNNQPSAQQLRMLVQQIQLAVHSGFLSSEILNQPLAPATLLLLNQLLSNIKHLQGAQQSLARGNNSNPLQINVAIAKLKQQIQNLQSQINAQQAIYIKQQQQQQQRQSLQQTPQQQQQQQHPATHINNASNEYLRGHDAISALQNSFSEININKASGYQGAANQQSRLNQWKLPVLEKDMTTDSTDFSRAPGTTKQSLTATNANNMGPLGLQNDGTWSTGRNLGDGWPDPSTDNENKDWSVAQPNTATTYTDLVQEFEPGKPWKGSQIKSIEDDPSITPGSVARSPLSINPTPKDADIFANAGKNSPTDLPPLSLSSSTWSFNPNQNFQSWSDNHPQCTTSELWAPSLNKTSRGPPPGLSSSKGSGGVSVSSATNPNAVGGNSNGWLGGRSVPNANATWNGANTTWNSNWLLLKNLTAQIDGSTLRTLCMQHGPLINFHLYLNQGIALCKYATREEASKAQMTLNNCVVGNSTICAESPSENEVQSILAHLPQTPTSTNNGGGAPGGNNGGGGNGGGGAGAGGGTNPANPGSHSGNGTNSGSNGNGNGANSAAGGNGGVNNGNTGNNTSSSISNAVLNGGTSNPTNNSGSLSASGNLGKNPAHCGNNSTGPGLGQVNNVTNSASVVGSNSAWRQTTQNSQQNQSRPTGRETDFDFISQYVCSIVDD